MLLLRRRAEELGARRRPLAGTCQMVSTVTTTHFAGRYWNISWMLFLCHAMAIFLFISRNVQRFQSLWMSKFTSHNIIRDACDQSQIRSTAWPNYHKPTARVIKIVHVWFEKWTEKIIRWYYIWKDALGQMSDTHIYTICINVCLYIIDYKAAFVFRCEFLIQTRGQEYISNIQDTHFHLDDTMVRPFASYLFGTLEIL